MRTKYCFGRPDNCAEWWQEANDCTWYPTESEVLEFVDDLNDDLPPAGCEDEYNPYTGGSGAAETVMNTSVSSASSHRRYLQKWASSSTAFILCGPDRRNRFAVSAYSAGR
jgi:hypothetical protein